MWANGNETASSLFGEETKRYLESHPEVARQLQNAEKVYQAFGDYLKLTQFRVIVRESGASNMEANLGAALLRTDQ